jgi:hypothetical protein
MKALHVPSRRPEDPKKGVALIMVMVITTILSAIAADLKNESQVNLRAAANARDELQAHFHARSALELELFILRFQNMLKQTIGQFIPIPLFELSGFLVSSDTLKGVLDRDATPKDEAKPERAFSFDAPYGDFEGSFWIDEVVDENRKLNLHGNFGIGCENFLHLLMAAVFDDPKYDVLFETLGDSRDPIRNRLELIAAITDWIDGDENVDTVCILTQDSSISSVSEDTRYDHLPYNASYEPKNGLMGSLEELRMVPGVNDAFMRVFSRYFTVWSDNVGISMQTADDLMILAVIRAVSAGPPLPGDAEKYRKFFTEKALMTALPPPLNKLSQASFEQLLQTAEIAYDKQKLEKLVQKQYVRFEDISSVYKITAVGRVNDASSKITVVWRGFGTNGELYYWREE